MGKKQLLANIIVTIINVDIRIKEACPFALTARGVILQGWLDERV